MCNALRKLRSTTANGSFNKDGQISVIAQELVAFIIKCYHKYYVPNDMNNLKEQGAGLLKDKRNYYDMPDGS